MKNIIYYMKKFGNRTLDEMPFNEVDSLILCQLSYLNYENLVPGLDEIDDSIDYSELIHEDLMIIKMCQGTIDRNLNRKLLKLIRKKSRFKHMKINFYHRKFNPRVSKQFCAMTFIFDRFAHITFQGTDPSIIGWKEDFEMSFLEKIPAQVEAVSYLDRVAKIYHGPLYIGGHSKGGNLAYYSILNCEPHIRERTMRVFNHDGPGFKTNDIYHTEAYKEMKSRMIKVVPKDTIVGLLMHHNDAHQVVECYGAHFLQHDVFTWKINNIGHLNFLSNGSIRYKIFAKASMIWMDSISDEERKRFTDTFFNLIGAMGNVSVIDAIKHPLTYWRTVHRRYKKMSQEDRKFLYNILFSYGKVSRQVKKDFRQKRRHLRQLKRLKKGF